MSTSEAHREIEQLAPRERAWLRWLRRIGWTLIGVYFIAAASLLVARYWLVPQLPAYRAAFEEAASEALGQRVSIASFEADWYGFHPWVELRGVTVHDRDGRPALELPQVRAVIAWRSLPARELRLRMLVIDDADLDIRRTADGRLYVAGLELASSPTASESSAADWVLRQGEIHVRRARIEWLDEERGAPPLQLSDFNLLVRNSGNTHEFAVRASPPAEYGEALDLRGRLSGRSFAQLRDWNGELYAAIDALDLDAWQQWVDYPVELTGGRGALRMWLTVAQRDLAQLRTRVALTDVRMRVAPELPALELAALQGELGASRRQSTLAMLGLGNGHDIYEAYGRNLHVRPVVGGPLQPIDFTARWEAGEDGEPARGEVRAETVELARLAQLSEHFLLPQGLRTLVQRVQPTGLLQKAEYAWQGPVQTPQSYEARARFSGLGMAPYEDIPGFDGLEGNFSLTERGGRVRAEGRRMGIHYPGVFMVERFAFDRLNARVNWTLRDGGVRVRLEDVQFDNADASGTVTGEVRTTAAGTQWLDLSGRASRARGAAVYKYIPELPTEVGEWLREGILQGQASDVRFRLKGDLNDFPYSDPRKGEFKVSAKLAGVQLHYADGWPRIDDIVGRIEFDGPRLDIEAARAVSVGAQLHGVRASFADLYADHPVLRVTGNARGATADFLKFIDRSPVREFIGGWTDGWRAKGPGQLQLSLTLPLDDLEHSKVAGSFRFEDNTIVMAPDDPPMTQVNGPVNFSERGASSEGIDARFIGGPLAVRIAQRDDAVVVTAAGSGEAAGLVRLIGLPIGERVRGMTDYHAIFTTRDGRTDSLITTDLRGVDIDLPPPFSKRAAESWPLRVERNAESATRQRLSARLGTVLAMQGVLRKDGARMVLDRAGVAIGSVAVPRPAGAHIAVAVNVPQLNVDALAPLASGGTEAGVPGMAPLGAIDLRTDALIGAGRIVRNVQLQAQLHDRIWRADINARELAGTVSWLPQGNGVIKARLRHLYQPETVQGATDALKEYENLPALDVVAERYVLDGRELGRLELQAFNEQGGWRIDHAQLGTPHGTASATGRWRPARSGPERTDLAIAVKASDLGAYLADFGYVGAIRGGHAELTGNLGWNGPPTELHYATLSGELRVVAEDGQFVQLQPGVGRLLGVLSLQSLPRRITLDFKDVFGEGFAFDRIDGTATVTRGVMKTDNLGMVGPSATVLITGTADIARETQNLHVRVVPTVGDSVAAAAGLALLNPVVGVGAWIAQRLLKDPLGRMLAFEYEVTGSWDDPQVRKLGEPEAPAASAQRGGQGNEAQ